MIFVQIASYRDPELNKTLWSMVSNADHPENLNICIVWQYKDEGFPVCNANLQVIPVECNLSQGVGWARNLVQKFYTNEEYTLQIDSHMRFAKGWDTTLIEMLKLLPSEKPAITTYAPLYNPITEERINNAWIMQKDERWGRDGLWGFVPAYSEHTEPMPTLFYSAHLCFTSGSFIRHDPEIYFTGEEITIAARAYTHGYDMYHPHVPVIWHEYTREGRVKQWDDDKDWWMKDLKSKEIVRSIMDGSYQGEYGYGTKRSIEQFKSLI